MDYSFEELADIHLGYGAANCRGRESARQQPHHTIFSSTYRCLRERGNLKRPGGTGRNWS